MALALSSYRCEAQKWSAFDRHSSLPYQWPEASCVSCNHLTGTGREAGQLYTYVLIV
jgi:hypothetical protein